MPVTEESAALVEAYRRSHVALRGLVGSDVARIMPLLEFSNIRGSWPAVEAAIINIVTARRTQSVALTSEFLRRLRRAEGIVGTFTPVPASTLNVDLLAKNLRIAGPGKAVSLLRTNRADILERTFTSLEGEASRNVLNGGRETTVNSIVADKQCIGWIRVTDGDPCPFCRMLASRGPVYKSAKSAVAGSFYSETVKDFRAHPHCGCVAKPMYDERDPWPGRGEEFADEWEAATKDAGSGRDAFNAYRRSLGR